MSSTEELPQVIIRSAEKTDCAEIARLIKDLAEYEGNRDRAKLTKEVLEEDGFGKDRWFYSVVAEDPNGSPSDTGPPRLIGHVVYYLAYYSNEGRAVFIDDMYVAPDFRKKGIEEKLLKNTAQAGVESNCAVMFLTCPSQNHPRMALYKHLGAEDLTETEAWTNFVLDGSDLRKLASS